MAVPAPARSKPPVPRRGPSSAAPTTGIKADFNMFLKLLTTQMQNQDPLSPMDTSQYTQQLVQYSQVEQSVQQNTTLNSILSNLSNQGLTQADPTEADLVVLNTCHIRERATEKVYSDIGRLRKEALRDIGRAPMIAIGIAEKASRLSRIDPKLA
ncbi:flagellar hook capping FlgD N-terminal domain-containing protein [Streptomyces sp. S399]|nr:flagellar hook capping FlgD N-terminal domain-containing protein [Streptomyces sp. S399]WPR54578.1 flagellar hook capping FlgD N-terminal domain-containing protein [Streptomyces sp. S399]